MTTIHERIKKVRIDAGLTQQQFADLIGVNISSAQAWEGYSTPKDETLQRIADALKITVDQLKGVSPADDVLKVMTEAKEKLAKIMGIAASRFNLTMEVVAS